MHSTFTVMFPRHPIFLLAIASSTLALAETRPWKSVDGVRSVQGDFVKRDATSVTIRTAAGKELVIELPKLHPDETKWLNQNHPLGGPPPDPAAFFDNLTFKDTRESTLAKLKASKIVEMTVDETFIGRSGLNGIFQTRKKIGNLSGFLYFDWTGVGKLKELTLQTETRPGSAYKAELEPSWKELVELLGTLYGKPVQEGPMPKMESLAAGTFAPTHLWKIDTGGSALLGTAREGSLYQLVVRFTQSTVQPVELP